MNNQNVTVDVKNFNNKLVEFIKYVREIVTQKNEFNLYYKYYKSFDNVNEFILEFVSLLNKYNREISEFDECLFSEEIEYYPNQPIYLFKNIDFKQIWTKNVLTKDNKLFIWKNLQVLYILGNHVTKEFNNLNTNTELINNMIKTLKLNNKIKETAKKQNELEKLEDEKDKIDFSTIFEIFGEDNIITSIVVEIAKEMNLAKTILSNPFELIKKIFAPNSQELQNIINSISDKIKEKMISKNITEERLMEDAKKMQEKLMNKFKNMSGMPEGFAGIPEKLFEYLKKFTDGVKVNQNNNDSQSSSHNNDNIPSSSNDNNPLSESELKAKLEELQKSIFEMNPNMNIEEMTAMMDKLLKST